MPDHDEDPLSTRLPTVLGGTGNARNRDRGDLGQRKAGLPSPDAVLSLANPNTGSALTGPVYAIGDSVLLGAKSCLAKTDVKVHARENRTMRAGASRIEKKAAAGKLPPRVVVALGTNGPFGYKALDRIMRASGPDRAVYWVTTELPRSIDTRMRTRSTSDCGRCPVVGRTPT